MCRESLGTKQPEGCMQKKKEIQFPVLLLLEKKKGFHYLNFFLHFLRKGCIICNSFRKRKKECISLNLFFDFFRNKAKGTCVSEFFCHRKKNENMPSEFNFSIPGRSGDKKDQLKPISRKMIFHLDEKCTHRS